MSTTKKDWIFQNAIILGILIFTTILLSINISKPFYGHHDWNGAHYSNIARNLVKYGLLETKFGSVTNSGIVEKENFLYFTHYPPILPISLYIAFIIFGVSEASARLVPIAFTILSIFSVYVLTKNYFDKKTAILASFIYSIFPITIYFGKMPVQEVLVIPFVVFSIFFYFNFFKNPNKSNFLKIFIFLALSHLTNWPGYYVTPLFFLHFLLFAKVKNKFAVASTFPFFSVFMFSVHAFHAYILTGEFLGGGLLDAALFRLNLSSSPANYSTLNFLINQLRMLVIYFTRPALVLSGVLLISLFFNISKIKKDIPLQIIAMLGIFGITHNVVFRNMAFIHDYMIIYLSPFFAISASYSFFQIASKFKKIGRYKIGLASLLLIIIFSERLNYLKTLINSDRFNDGYFLGKVINERTNEMDKILLASPDFKMHYEVFTNYYSDREIEYSLPTQKQLEEPQLIEKYNLVVVIPTRDNSQYLAEYLENKYKKTNVSEFLIYETKK